MRKASSLMIMFMLLGGGIFVLLEVPEGVQGYDTSSEPTITEWTMADLDEKSGGAVIGGGSSYIIHDDVEISNGDTLTIEKGTRIEFQGAYSLIVDGTLLVLGTQTEPVIFDWDGVTNWGSIKFQNTISGSIISHARINHATNGVWIDGTSPRINDTTIQYNLERGIWVQNSGMPEIVDNIINNNYDYGIHIESSSSPHIERCNLSENGDVDMTDAGLFVESSNPTTIENVELWKSNRYGLRSLDSEFTVGNSTIRGSSSTNVWIGKGLASLGSTITMLNTSYDKGSSYVGSDSTLYVSWIVDVFVNDTDGNPISNSNLIIDDSTSVEVFNGYTNAQGEAKAVQLLEYTQTTLQIYPVVSYKTLHNFMVTKDGYVENISTISIESFRSLSFTLKPLTYHSGKTTGSEMWTVEENPHVINGDFTISNGHTIIIDPGVIIKVEDGFSFFIEGIIWVNGREDNPVLLTSESDSPTSGIWNSMQFNQESIDTSYIHWMEIEFADVGITFTDASPDVSNVTITDSTTGMLFDNSKARIEDATVTDCVDGLHFTNDAAPRVSGVAISHISDDALLIEGSSPFIESATLDTLVDQNNGVKSIGASSTVLSNSTITGTGLRDIDLSGNSKLFARNVDFNSGYVVIDTSELHRQWYLDMEVLDSSNLQPLDGAEIILKESENGTAERLGVTGADGWIRSLVATEYMKTSSSTTYYNPHNITISKAGFNVHTSNITIYDNLEQTFQLTPLDIDLFPLNVSLSNQQPKPDESIIITVIVHNSGTDTAENVRVELYMDDDTEPIEADIILAIPGGENGTAPLITTVPVGNHTYWIRVDPDNNIIEDDDDNNDISVSIHGNEPPKAFINSTLAGQTVSGIVPINGTASDNITDGDLNITHVWLSFNDGPWVDVDGWESSNNNASVNWTYNWDSASIAFREYNVSVMASDGVYNSTIDTVQVFVANDIPPTAVIDEPSEGQTFFTNQSIFFNASGSNDTDGNITHYYWDFDDTVDEDDDGNFVNDREADGVHVYHSFPEKRVYNITLEVIDDTGMNDSTYVRININNFAPVALGKAIPLMAISQTPFEFQGNESYDPETMILPIPPLTKGVWNWTWDFGNDERITESTASGGDGVVSHTYQEAGVYTVTLTVYDFLNAYNSTSFTVNVISRAPVIDSASADKSHASKNEVVNFLATAHDTDGHIALFEWDFDGDGTYDWQSASSGNTSHSYPLTGTYEALLRITDNSGNSTVSANPVTVIVTGEPPSASIQNPNESEIVSGTYLVNITATDSGGDTVLEAQFRVGSGSWKDATHVGADTWQYSWNTTGLQNGNHTLYSRARDADGWTEEPYDQKTVYVQNGKSSINLTLALEPESAGAEATVTVSGIAAFNTGEPVALTQVTIRIEDTDVTDYATTDAAGEYTLDLSAPAAAGTYTISVNISKEGFKADETATLTVNTAAKPDLTVESIFFSPSSPEAGTNLLVTVVVGNSGGISATGIVRIYNGDPDDGVVELRAAQSPQVPQGESRGVNIWWNDTSLVVGEITIFAKVTEVSPDESDTTNNKQSAALTFSGKPKLAITSIVLSNSEPVEGSVVKIMVYVRNTGVVAADNVQLKIYDGTPTAGRLIEAVTTNVATGLTEGVEISWYNTITGTHDIYAVIANTPPLDSDTSDNTYNITVQVVKKTTAGGGGEEDNTIIYVLVALMAVAAGLAVWLVRMKWV